MARFSVRQMIFLWLGVCISLPVRSQNLVPNPSFESFLHCPGHLGNFSTDVEGWSTPTAGSTDYFNSCSLEMGTPKNFNGVQPANFGKGYAGLYLFAPDDYREYFQVELTETLRKGTRYQVSFYVSLAERSDFAVKEFGVLFSNNKIALPIKKELSKKRLYQQKNNVYNYLEIGYSNFYSDTQDWVLVHTRFEAKGSEKYLVMGNFKDNSRTRLFQTKRNAKQGAYYYVDMVEVVEDQSDEVKADAPIVGRASKPFELDKTHVFEDVLFTFDKATLLETAKVEVDRIYSFLSEHKNLNISINGYTDTVGNEKYNRSLSERRAKAVADYLLRLGLEKNRVAWKGHGGKRPIASNATAQGRKRNRRVEFVISGPKP